MAPMRTDSMVENGVFWVDRIVAEDIQGDQILYLVKWKGVGEKGNRWEPPENLDPDTISEWETGESRNYESPPATHDAQESRDFFNRFQNRMLRQNDGRVGGRGVPLGPARDMPADGETDDKNNEADSIDGLTFSEDESEAGQESEGDALGKAADDADDNLHDAEASDADSTMDAPGSPDVDMEDVGTPANDGTNATADAQEGEATGTADQHTAPVDQTAYMDVIAGPAPQQHPCNDPIQHALGITNHHQDFLTCQHVNHAGPPVNTCTTCYFTAVDRLPPMQRDACVNGAFFRICGTCVQADIDDPADFPFCDCLLTPYCSTCLPGRMSFLALSKVIFAAREHVIQQRCTQCAGPLAENYVMYKCVHCGGHPRT